MRHSVPHPVIWPKSLLKRPGDRHERILLTCRQARLVDDAVGVFLERVEVRDRAETDEVALEDLDGLRGHHSTTARNFVSSKSASRPNPSSTSLPPLVVHRTITPSCFSLSRLPMRAVSYFETTSPTVPDGIPLKSWRATTRLPTSSSIEKSDAERYVMVVACRGCHGISRRPRRYLGGPRPQLAGRYSVSFDHDSRSFNWASPRSIIFRMTANAVFIMAGT